MASTYSNLKIQLMATGENSGTWGNVTNENLGTAIEEAIVGHAKAQSKVHREYGSGYPLEVKREWINKGANVIRGFAR